MSDYQMTENPRTWYVWHTPEYERASIDNKIAAWAEAHMQLERELAEATKLLETGRVGFMNRIDEATWLASVSAWLHNAQHHAEAGRPIA